MRKSGQGKLLNRIMRKLFVVLEIDAQKLLNRIARNFFVVGEMNSEKFLVCKGLNSNISKYIRKIHTHGISESALVSQLKFESLFV